MTRYSSSVLRTVREQLALKQWELGSWLRIARERVAKEENGSRPLSAAVMAKLLPLLAVLPAPLGPRPATAPPPAASETAVLDALRARLRDCQQEAEIARHALSKLRPRAEALRRRLVVLPALRAALEGVPPTPTHGRDVEWIELMISGAHYELAACGTAAQTLLEARVLGLEAEAVALAAKLAAHPPTP